MAKNGQYKVLTFFLTKDSKTFSKINYLRVLMQNGILQDVYVVSAEPVSVERNIVIKVPQHLPLPVRIGISINIALKKFDIMKYDYIFKIDGDITLPLDYCKNILEKKPLVGGRGAALLISVPFFMRLLRGKYPVNYCDDGYISALSVAVGHWPPEYTGKGILVIPVVRQPLREYGYGVEYYKWGLPLTLLLVLSFVLLFTRKKDLKSIIYNFAGFIHAILNSEKKYPWWRSYRYFRLSHVIHRGVEIFKKVLSFTRRSHG